MKLYIVYWQNGAGFCSLYFIQKENAEKRKEEIEAIFEKNESAVATNCNLEVFLEEIETQD